MNATSTRSGRGDTGRYLRRREDVLGRVLLLPSAPEDVVENEIERLEAQFSGLDSAIDSAESAVGSFDGAARAADGADRLADDLDGVDDAAERAGRGLDGVGDAADTADTRAMGFRDTITGVQDSFRGLTDDSLSMQERLLLLGMGIGDLGSGIYNFVVPALKAAKTSMITTATSAVRSAASHAASAATTVAGWVVMGAQATVNAVKMAAAWLISLGPVGLVIAAVAAIIAILVALGVDFDTVKDVATAAWNVILGAVHTAFNWVKDNWPLLLAILTGPIGLAVLAIAKNWDTIMAAATAAKDWIVDRFNDLVGFVTGLPGRIYSATIGMFSGIVDAMRSALNSIIGLWNSLDLGISFSLSVPSWVPGIGGRGFSINVPDIIPDVPFLEHGGIATAPTLAMIGEGRFDEAVIPLPRGLRNLDGMGGGVTINQTVHGSVISERELISIVRDELNRGGMAGVR